MAEFLSTRGISYNLEAIIKNATRELIIITPYLNFSTPIYEQLRAVSKVVKVCFIYGKKELYNSQERLIKELNCDILYKENLHAKCYLNENTALIGSMNLMAFSEVNNYEMGVLLDSIADKKAYDECKNEIELISLNARQIRKIDRVIVDEKVNTKEYDRSGFNSTWIKFLKSNCLGVKIEETEKGITFFDYPTKNLNLTTNYGIVSFEIQLPFEKCREIRDKNTENMILGFKNYRVFWNNPYDKIHLYCEKKIQFNSLVEELEYCKKGLSQIVVNISKYKFE